MQRNLLIAMALFILLLAAALGYVLLRGQSAPAPISINAANENAVEPLHQEMDCIDRLLENRNNLNANEVDPAIARCRGASAGNQSLGQ